MRSTAGILAALALVFAFGSCGGDDEQDDPTPGGGSGGAGKGGTTSGNKGGTTGKGGSSTGGEPSEGGTAGTPPVGCQNDDDCENNQTCVDGDCLLNTGEDCTAGAECATGACVDDLCTDLLPDGEPCTADTECAHTCIADECAPASGVGGPCDEPDSGAGGAGGGASTGGAGGAGEPAVNPDCDATLECTGGTCLTPDGGDCVDNVDCVNTCVDNVCAPLGTLDGNCDDDADCNNAALVCDAGLCKLDVLAPCSDNAQCESNRCICSDSVCGTRVCKNADAVCGCKWSPADSATCDGTSANLNFGTADPNGGCTAAQFCSAGGCVSNAAGTCTQTCQDVDPAADVVNCQPSGGPSQTCAGGYDEVPGTCTNNKGVCSATCNCCPGGDCTP